LHSVLLPPVTIDILEGDITARRVDAIVNAANSAFWMGSGVAGAIKARGGVEIEREAVAKGPVEPGESVITGAGKLPCRHVIHAAAMGQDLLTDARLIERATSSALDLAAAHGLTSIAFPALGTGVGGFPVEECARLMMRAVRQHVSADTPLRTIEFVLFGRDAYDRFVRSAELDGAQ
jgi:O-acetyl-ADP-ribose deacetylase (regulator of RNase III)